MWAKHWREVLKYLWLCLHVFSGSVSYDVTASAHKSLLQWLLEQYAFFFFFCISSLNTRTCSQKYTSIYIYICAYAQAETNTEWLSSVFYLLNQFSKLQYCSLFLFKMPKAIFPTFLFSLQGCQAFDKARQAKLPGMGSSSLDHALLNVFLKVRRSAHPLITRQLGLQHWPCTPVLGNPGRPSWWSLRAKEGDWAREAEVLWAQTAIRWCQECCGVTTITHEQHSAQPGCFPFGLSQATDWYYVLQLWW